MTSLYKTIVCFRSSYDKIWVDSSMSFPWDKERVVADLMSLTEDPTCRDEAYAQLDQEKIKSIASAYQVMLMRVRMNPDMQGPHIIDSDHEPSDEELVAWAKENLYGKK